MQLTVRKTRPPLVTFATTDKQCRSHTTLMFSRSEKYIAEQRGNSPTEKTEQVPSDMKQGLRTLSF